MKRSRGLSNWILSCIAICVIILIIIFVSVSIKEAEMKKQTEQDDLSIMAMNVDYCYDRCTEEHMRVGSEIQSVSRSLWQCNNRADELREYNISETSIEQYLKGCKGNIPNPPEPFDIEKCLKDCIK